MTLLHDPLALSRPWFPPRVNPLFLVQVNQPERGSVRFLVKTGRYRREL